MILLLIILLLSLFGKGASYTSYTGGSYISYTCDDRLCRRGCINEGSATGKCVLIPLLGDLCRCMDKK
ncbi:unnamed protein product [Cylicocyclus nassatus]|uniref:Uncharacterized protein n=1 Tax=Cylicocyclus nassatus TaxID=53992 RepID=A0AA36M249_CYLNA|nr:unnamed protein product [Cylicocyclus nassatus]